MNEQSGNQPSYIDASSMKLRDPWPLVDPCSITLPGLSEVREHLPGTVLLRRGEDVRSVSVIRHGLVRLSVTELDRPVNTLGLRSKDWWIGCASALSGATSLYDVTTLTTCWVASIRTEEFRSGLLEKPELLSYFLAQQCRELLMTQYYSIAQGSDSTQRIRLVWDRLSQREEGR